VLSSPEVKLVKENNLANGISPNKINTLLAPGFVMLHQGFHGIWFFKVRVYPVSVRWSGRGWKALLQHLGCGVGLEGLQMCLTAKGWERWRTTELSSF